MATKAYKPTFARSPKKPVGDLTTLMRKVDTRHFVNMVGKCGMPRSEAQELVAAFKDNK